jgi:hypothetical protein
MHRHQQQLALPMLREHDYKPYYYYFGLFGVSQSFSKGEMADRNMLHLFNVEDKM